jgi:multiple sugar transport system permease protein
MTRPRVAASQVAVHAALAAGAAAILLPFAWMTLTALRPPDEVFGGLWSGSLTLENFARVWHDVDWPRLYLNGALVTCGIFLGQVLVCLPAAWALARLRFRGSRVALVVVLASLVIPPQATAVPVFLMLSELGLIDTRTALIVPFIGSAFAIFLFRQFLLTVPQSLIDAARLDGVSELGMVWHVALPLVRPAIAALAVFTIAFHWNDLFWPFLVLRSDDAATVPYGIVRYSNGEAGTDYAAQMSAAVLAIAPLVIGFLLAQRHVVRGIAFAEHDR